MKSVVYALAGCAAGAFAAAILLIWHPDDVQYWHDRMLGADKANRYQVFAAGMVSRIDANAGLGRVVLLGDSIVAGMDASAVHPLALNLGVGFDNTRNLRERVRAFRSLDGARAIFISIGTNDLPLRNVESIAQDYDALLAELPKDVPVWVSAVLPVDDRIARSRPSRKIVLVNERLRALCERHSSCMFVPAPAALMDEAGRLKGEYHEGDGLHLNASGYAVWKPVLSAALHRGELSSSLAGGIHLRQATP